VKRVCGLASLVLLVLPLLCGQDQNPKRIFWIIPNYRTYPTLKQYKSISASEKFQIANADALDRGTFGLAALFAGEGQLTRSDPSFGNGVPGYAHYFVTSYADWAVGDYMTEAIYPVLLHQDPRYFRLGSGGFGARLGHAMGQVLWVHKDSGGMEFNYSEILGNASAVAISNAYYPDGRSASSAVSRLGTQIGVDMMSNVLKEFWPDLARRFSHRHGAP
jgi:hypothetical protein